MPEQKQQSGESGAIVDVHGNRYHLGTWYADARNAAENRKLRSEALFDRDDETVRMRKVLLDEAGELAATPIDLGTHILTRQEDGGYLYQKK